MAGRSGDVCWFIRTCVWESEGDTAEEEEFGLHPVASQRIQLWGGLFLLCASDEAKSRIGTTLWVTVLCLVVCVRDEEDGGWQLTPKDTEQGQGDKACVQAHILVNNLSVRCICTSISALFHSLLACSFFTSQHLSSFLSLSILPDSPSHCYCFHVSVTHLEAGMFI